jgi:hypothetical protein
MVPTSLSRRHSTKRALTAAALVTALLVTACTAPATVQSGPPDAGRPADGRVLAGSLHGRSGAYLIVRGAASRVEVRLAEIPGLLYRISTPADSGLAPRVTGGDGMVRLGLLPTGGAGPDTVTILLSRRVRWDIRLPSGAGEQRLDLADGKVARIDLGSSGLVDVTLPRPVGTVDVRLTGGVGDAVFTGYGPMRFALGQGARAIRTPWVAANGSPPGSVVVQPGWIAAADRYAVHARAGIDRLTVIAGP